MVETNQALNNIKMLKLYSWQDLFEAKINQMRDFELALLKKQGAVISLMIGFVYLFPNLMPAVCFTTYIWFDFQPYLNLATGTSCIMYFQLIRGPMIWVPRAVSDFI